MNKKIKSLIPESLFNFLKYVYSLPRYYNNRNLFEINIKYKNKYKGKRCFILGSGPSIKKENLKPLKNEIVFALNNFYVHEDYKHIMENTDIPKFHMTAPIHSPQTNEEWISWFKDMEKYIHPNTKLFFGLNARQFDIKTLIEENDIFNDFSINWYYASRYFNYKKLTNKGLDITKPIITAEAVSVYALIIATYMGFDKIILLGMDHDYFLYDSEKDMRMYSNALHQKDEFKRTFGDDFYIDEFLRQYKIFKKYRMIDINSDSKIINASNGGILKVYPKMTLTSILKEKDETFYN